jgi:hypothetical protein
MNMETAARVSLVPTPTGLPSARVRRPQGGFVSLHSLHDPWEEACRFAETVELLPDTGLLVVLGLGLGYHVLALAHRLRTLESTAALWAVELDDEVLASCMKNTDLGLLFKLPEARVLSQRGLGRLRALEQEPPDFGVQVIRHAAACSLAPGAYAVWEAAVEELGSRRRLARRSPGLTRWLENAPAGAVGAVREAAKRIREAGPPYGEDEAILLLLERVHHYE